MAGAVDAEYVHFMLTRLDRAPASVDAHLAVAVQQPWVDLGLCRRLDWKDNGRIDRIERGAPRDRGRRRRQSAARRRSAAAILLLLVDRYGRSFYAHGHCLAQFSSDTLVIYAPVDTRESVPALRRDVVSWFAGTNAAINGLVITLRRTGGLPFTG